MTTNELSPKEIATRIRDKVADLNDELILAAAAELDVEFMVTKAELGEAAKIGVWCSQEVR